MPSRTALITGITGQDGYYLARLLLSKGYRVFGMVRSESAAYLNELRQYGAEVEFLQADLLDQGSLIGLIEQSEPDEVYNLAAHTLVPSSWTQPILTGQLTGLGALRMLEAIRLINPKIRFFQASSSEVFGRPKQSPQNEDTPFAPTSPYGASKLFGQLMASSYRRRYGMFACSGILFNHESPRRPTSFVTRKITRTAARIKLGLADELRLGNLDSARDWGHAKDYVTAMWLMLQAKRPEDYVIGTGEAHKVQEFVQLAFHHLDLDWTEYVVIDPGFVRSVDPVAYLADSTRLREELPWNPEVNFKTLVHSMVDSDLEAIDNCIA